MLSTGGAARAYLLSVNSASITSSAEGPLLAPLPLDPLPPGAPAAAPAFW